MAPDARDGRDDESATTEGVTPDVPWHLAARRLAGTASPAEEAALAAWTAGDPARAELIERLTAIWSASESALLSPHDAHDPGAGWSRVARRMSGLQLVSEPGPRPWSEVARATLTSPVQRFRMGAIGMAALAIVAVVTLAVTQVSDRRTLLIAERVATTAPGQRSTITFADGTRMTLAPATRVRYAADFGTPGAVREVLLDGEAYFEVAHDARRPFRVIAANAVTEDIGTRFAVRAYPEDSTVRVLVAEGAVALAVRSRDDSHKGKHGPAPDVPVLRGGTIGELDREGRTRVTAGVDPSEYLAWRDGRLVFGRAPLVAVAHELSRWYGVDVQVTDPVLAARHVSATVTETSIAAALDLIAPAVDARWARRANVYTLFTASATHNSSQPSLDPHNP